VSLAGACNGMKTSVADAEQQIALFGEDQPAAWRWNRETESSCSSALTFARPRDGKAQACSPAWVKLPASAPREKTFSRVPIHVFTSVKSAAP